MKLVNNIMGEYQALPEEMLSKRQTLDGVVGQLGFTGSRNYLN